MTNAHHTTSFLQRNLAAVERFIRCNCSPIECFTASKLQEEIQSELRRRTFKRRKKALKWRKKMQGGVVN
jgi:hypothetical protein